MRVAVRRATGFGAQAAGRFTPVGNVIFCVLAATGALRRLLRRRLRKGAVKEPEGAADFFLLPSCIYLTKEREREKE